TSMNSLAAFDCVTVWPTAGTRQNSYPTRPSVRYARSFGQRISPTEPDVGSPAWSVPWMSNWNRTLEIWPLLRAKISAPFRRGECAAHRSLFEVLMPRIFDNIDLQLLPALQDTLRVSE